jgi:simple sugar transport system ATP-binding protein
VLEIRDLCCESDRDLPVLEKLNLVVSGGEIVGIAGVDGNGQKELAECIAGTRKHTGGEIYVCGEKVQGVVSDASKLGFIPEDRQKTGLISSFNISENMVLKTITHPKFTQFGIVHWDRVNSFTQEMISQYSVRVPSPLTKASMLSGGNQQRVILARELNAGPQLLICSQPTRGLDLGAVESFHEMLLAERNRGAGILFISTELSEVMSISDRIIVMFMGRIMGELPGNEASLQMVGEMMLGRRLEEVRSAGGSHA